jgi:hypothetical protein
MRKMEVQMGIPMERERERDGRDLDMVLFLSLTAFFLLTTFVTLLFSSLTYRDQK